MISNCRVCSLVVHKQRLLQKGTSKLHRTSTCIQVKSTNIIRSFAGSSHVQSPSTWSRHLTAEGLKANYFIDNQKWQQSSSRRLSSSSTSSPERLFPEELNILYDSKCNVCKLEMDFLARRDASRSVSLSQPRKLKLTDLEDESYNPNDPTNGGVTYAKAMASMHAVKPDGQVVEGVAVFSVAYDLVGLGWLFRFTEWPITKPIVQFGYDVFAKYRTSVTRGSSLESLVEAYEARQASKQPPEDCATGTCNIPVSDKR
mmetsp:Transcript_8507/g.20476  ORF Transcript_8507/g.20476 Transcript_8507/m.20476 type:complete len:258 (+) Transcript_8507:91-864(+)